MVQNHFYKGWSHGYYVTNLFLFPHDARLCQAYINAPSTTHDSTMADMTLIYNKVDEVNHYYGGKTKILVDSSFAADHWPSLVKSYQNVVGDKDQLCKNRQVYHEASTVRIRNEGI